MLTVCNDRSCDIDGSIDNGREGNVSMVLVMVVVLLLKVAGVAVSGMDGSVGGVLL